ncbi:MAG: 50S ribosomal protein L18 [Patescibacteria group bacterium]|nr:50S ribosomal protein L18 [Patescibacteria group bacterium]
MLQNKTQKQRRQIRVRAKIFGTKDKPRLSVFKSNKFIFTQIINDEIGKTIVGLSEKELPVKGKSNKTERAKQLGIVLAKKALDKKIKTVVFDRGSYLYHGRIKALAEGAREGGLKF